MFRKPGTAVEALKQSSPVHDLSKKNATKTTTQNLDKKRSFDTFLEGSSGLDTAVKSSAKKRKKTNEDKELEKTPAPPSKESSEPPMMLTKGEATQGLESFESFVELMGDWKGPMKNAIATPGFMMLYKYVKKEYETQICYPPAPLIFNAYRQAPIQDVKVVIVGQDPYIQENQAMGMSFAITQSAKFPPSLRNIYKALANDPDIDFTMPAPLHGNLTPWARQGVFLLNTVLTVRAGKSNSHKKRGWEEFTRETIRQINKSTEHVVYLLWGKQAHETAKLVNESKNLVVLEQHPSPLAGTGFVTSKCFSQCNQYLLDHGRSPINWRL